MAKPMLSKARTAAQKMATKKWQLAGAAKRKAAKRLKATHRSGADPFLKAAGLKERVVRKALGQTLRTGIVSSGNTYSVRKEVSRRAYLHNVKMAGKKKYRPKSWNK